MKVTSLITFSIQCHVMTKMTVHYLSYILLVISKLPVLLKVKGRGLHKGVNTSRWGSLGSPSIYHKDINNE